MDHVGLTPMTEAQLKIQREEDELLQSFALLTRDSEAVSAAEQAKARLIVEKSTYQLENVFDSTGESTVKVHDATFEEKHLPTVLSHYQPKATADTIGTAATVSQSVFTKRFAECHAGLLDGLDWSTIFVAGGSVLSCLLPDAQHEYSHADIDIFVLTRDTEKAHQIVKRIYDVVCANVASKTPEERYRKVECFNTRRTVTIRTAWKVFQLVTTLYESPLEVLIGFDIDSGCVGTLDGKSAVLTQRGRQSLSKRYNLWMLESRPALAHEGRYQRRLLKYAKKGFAVLVPNVDWSKLPSLDKKKPDELSGVALLALYDRFITISASKPDHEIRNQQSHLFVSGIEECIHGGDSWCIHCHKGKTQSSADPTERLSFATPIQWEIDRVVYQDIEGGKMVRNVSHHYTPQLDFEKLVYSPTMVSSDPSGHVDGTSSASTPQRTEETEDPFVDVYVTSSDGPRTEPQNRGIAQLSCQQGINVPDCYCGEPCALKAVKKPGPNHHRRFFCCRNSMLDTSCKYFQWEGKELTYDQDRAQRLKGRINEAKLAENLQGLQLDTSKQLLALASCFKSGRITSSQRTILKDLILSHTEKSSPLDSFFFQHAEDGNLDALAQNLAQYCESETSKK